MLQQLHPGERQVEAGNVVEYHQVVVHQLAHAGREGGCAHLVHGEALRLERRAHVATGFPVADYMQNPRLARHLHEGLVAVVLLLAVRVAVHDGFVFPQARLVRLVDERVDIGARRGARPRIRCSSTPSRMMVRRARPGSVLWTTVRTL